MKTDVTGQEGMEVTPRRRVIAVAVALLGLLSAAAGKPGDTKGDPCIGFHGFAALGGDANQGCYIDVDYWDDWVASSNTNEDNPHGIWLEVVTPLGATITSTSFLSGCDNWIVSAVKTVPSPNVVYWSKLPVQPVNPPVTPGNAIPQGAHLKIRVRIDNPGGSDITFRVKELKGILAAPTYGPCWRDTTFAAGGVVFDIPDTNICTGQWAWLHVFPDPQTIAPGALVSWYGANYPCPPTPTLPLGPEWTWLKDGADYITPVMTSSACYVAVIRTGCFTYLSEVGTVTVCQRYARSISASPILNQNHACMSYSGTLTLDPSTTTCPTTIRWTRQLNNDPAVDITGNCTQPCWSVPTGQLVSRRCTNRYTFVATDSNACGKTSTSFVIFVDTTTTPGTLTASPDLIGGPAPPASIYNPLLCYGGYTQLNYTGGCGEVTRWEWGEGASPATWTSPIKPGDPGTGKQCWTNSLYQTTSYRVWMKNGACDEGPPVSIVVTVKPPLTVAISANRYDICTPSPPCVITATPSYTTGVTYQWYLDGEPISGATGQTINATTYGAGNYSVIVTDQQCGSAESNVIAICGKQTVVISGPCGICRGGSVTLTAVVFGGCEPFQYRWYRMVAGVWQPILGATGQSLVVSSPGEYMVKTKHGNCTAASPPFSVQQCPEIP